MLKTDYHQLLVENCSEYFGKLYPKYYSNFAEFDAVTGKKTDVAGEYLIRHSLDAPFNSSNIRWFKPQWFRGGRIILAEDVLPDDYCTSPFSNLLLTMLADGVELLTLTKAHLEAVLRESVVLGENIITAEATGIDITFELRKFMATHCARVDIEVLQKGVVIHVKADYGYPSIQLYKHPNFSTEMRDHARVIALLPQYAPFVHFNRNANGNIDWETAVFNGYAAHLLLNTKVSIRNPDYFDKNTPDSEFITYAELSDASGVPLARIQSTLNRYWRKGGFTLKKTPDGVIVHKAVLNSALCTSKKEIKETQVKLVDSEPRFQQPKPSVIQQIIRTVRNVYSHVFN